MYAVWDNIELTQDDFYLNLNLEINKGELVTLLGPSGCGKTTALRIAAGFTKPDKGKFYLDGRDMSNIPVNSRNIGIVFQNYALFPHMNVEENIAYGLKSRRVKKSIIKEEVDFIINSLHLKNYNKREINSLSGGEKQRVALGRSLAIKPELLLLDEPLSALDADLRKKLRVEIKSIQEEFKITTLYVTHDQEEALTISSRVALLKNGHLQQYSTPEDLYNRPVNRFSGEFIGESNLINLNGEILFFRPEAVKPGYMENAMNFKGRVENVEYLGHFSRGVLKCPDNIYIKVISYNHFHNSEYYVEYKDIIKF